MENRHPTLAHSAQPLFISLTEHWRQVCDPAIGLVADRRPPFSCFCPDIPDQARSLGKIRCFSHGIAQKLSIAGFASASDPLARLLHKGRSPDIVTFTRLSTGRIPSRSLTQPTRKPSFFVEILYFLGNVRVSNFPCCYPRNHESQTTGCRRRSQGPSRSTPAAGSDWA